LRAALPNSTAGSRAPSWSPPVGHLLEIFRGPPPPPEVTTSAASGRRRPGIRIHRSTLHPLDVSTFEGIRVTTLPRMLLDLAPRLTPEQLGRAWHEAWVRHDTRPYMVEACIARNPRKPGAAKLRRALHADVTLSIELLSYRFHASRHAFEADVARRRRSNHIACTYGDIVERPARTAGELRRLLAG
jgi:hypothetical protein